MSLAVAHVGGGSGAGGLAVTSDSWTSVANSCIVAIGHVFENTGAAVDGDITDSKSNTYTLRGQLYGGAGQPGIAIWESNNTTRGASHTVTFRDPGTVPAIANISVIEITGQHLTSDFDATTLATAADLSSPFSPWNVTAAAAISGNQIAIYGVTIDATAGSNAWTNPGGYSVIFGQGNADSFLASYSGYKLNETGTPTVGATRADTNVVGGRILIATFKEAGAPPQTLRPDADTADGGWTTTPLWSKVDEASAGGDVISATAS